MKSAIKKETDVSLRMSSSMIGNSDDETKVILINSCYKIIIN